MNSRGKILYWTKQRAGRTESHLVVGTHTPPPPTVVCMYVCVRERKREKVGGGREKRGRRGRDGEREGTEREKPQITLGVFLNLT